MGIIVYSLLTVLIGVLTVLGEWGLSCTHYELSLLECWQCSVSGDYCILTTNCPYWSVDSARWVGIIVYSLWTVLIGVLTVLGEWGLSCTHYELSLLECWQCSVSGDYRVLTTNCPYWSVDSARWVGIIMYSLLTVLIGVLTVLGEWGLSCTHYELSLLECWQCSVSGDYRVLTTNCPYWSVDSARWVGIIVYSLLTVLIGVLTVLGEWGLSCTHQQL